MLILTYRNNKYNKFLEQKISLYIEQEIQHPKKNLEHVPFLDQEYKMIFDLN